MTAETELAFLSLEDAAALVAARKVSPVELTRTMLDRIERLNPSLNAYITVTGDRAIDAARAAERDIVAGTYRGPLHGVPLAVKDLFATKGIRTTAGAKILHDWIPDFDATVVTKLRDASALSLGKLGLHEYAYGATSVNDHFGDIHNPWDLDRVPGGSSGGSSVAVAAGLAYAALGSDTGGSIRVPAALCGCVGLMPTFGRVSLHGAVPLAWSLDHAGPLTRTVRDAALVLQVISGHDPLDPATEQQAVPQFLDRIERGPHQLRVGVPGQYFWQDVDAEVERLVRGAIADLEGAGAEIRDVDFPLAVEYASANGTVLLSEAAAYHAPTFPSRNPDYSRQVAAYLELGNALPAPRYVNAMRLLDEARRGAADAVLEDVDVLAMPTVPVPAPTIAAIRAQEASPRLAALAGPFDLTGQPAISVPCGLNAQHLPVGIMFAGRRWDEASVLCAGRAYEQVRGPFPAPPA